MIFKIHNNSKIAYKRLSKADKGISSTSNQTHIGLFKQTLEFLTSNRVNTTAQLIFKNNSEEYICLIDYIQNPDGTYRSPKIRKGDDNDLYINNIKLNSIVREIWDIISNTSDDLDWYLMWFGLDNQELVFFLFNNRSEDYKNLEKILGVIKNRQIIENNDSVFNYLTKYINLTIEQANSDYLEGLEASLQLGIPNSKRLIPRATDVARAQEYCQDIGRKGEELVNEYFKKQLSAGNIISFKWVNEELESGLPYDFEIVEKDNTVIYTDVKSTAYEFKQNMYLSGNELNFINDNPGRYIIQRVYKANDAPIMRECRNMIHVPEYYIPLFRPFNQQIATKGLTVNTTVSVPVNFENLIFEDEIKLV